MKLGYYLPQGTEAFIWAWIIGVIGFAIFYAFEKHMEKKDKDEDKKHE